jgi:hypothetical protein
MGCLMEFLRVSNTILYENEFQNPQIFQQTISLFPEHSTLVDEQANWSKGAWAQAWAQAWVRAWARACR